MSGSFDIMYRGQKVVNFVRFQDIMQYEVGIRMRAHMYDTHLHGSSHVSTETRTAVFTMMSCDGFDVKWLLQIQKASRSRPH